MKMVVFVHECVTGNPLVATREYRKFHNRFNSRNLCRYYAIRGKAVWFDIYFFSE
jgi:hypothetical protein